MEETKAKRRFIRLPEVVKKVGMSRSTIYRRMEEGAFPQSIKLSPKVSVWIESDIDKWMEERIAEAHGKAPAA